MKTKTTRKDSFDSSLARLEAIVREMESGNLPLEKMMAQYEEGMRLIAFCNARLNEVEKKIEILTKKGDQMVAEPFHPEPDQKDENSNQQQAAEK